VGLYAFYRGKRLESGETFGAMKPSPLGSWGRRSRRKALFQVLTETFPPTFAWGYIWWGGWLLDVRLELRVRSGLRPRCLDLSSSLGNSSRGGSLVMCTTAWTTSRMSGHILRNAPGFSKRAYNISNAERAVTRPHDVGTWTGFAPCTLGYVARGVVPPMDFRTHRPQRGFGRSDTLPGETCRGT